MIGVNDKNFVLIGAGVAALLLVILVKKKGAAAAVGEAVGGAAVEVVTGAVAGGAQAIGDAVGIPRTNETECEKAKREGRTWDASFACPAGEFLSYLNPWGDD